MSRKETLKKQLKTLGLSMSGNVEELAQIKGWYDKFKSGKVAKDADYCKFKRIAIMNLLKHNDYFFRTIWSRTILFEQLKSRGTLYSAENLPEEKDRKNMCGQVKEELAEVKNEVKKEPKKEPKTKAKTMKEMEALLTECKSKLGVYVDDEAIQKFIHNFEDAQGDHELQRNIIIYLASHYADAEQPHAYAQFQTFVNYVGDDKTQSLMRAIVTEWDRVIAIKLLNKFRVNSPTSSGDPGPAQDSKKNITKRVAQLKKEFNQWEDGVNKISNPLTQFKLLGHEYRAAYKHNSASQLNYIKDLLVDFLILNPNMMKNLKSLASYIFGNSVTNTAISEFSSYISESITARNEKPYSKDSWKNFLNMAKKMNDALRTDEEYNNSINIYSEFLFKHWAQLHDAVARITELTEKLYPPTQAKYMEFRAQMVTKIKVVLALIDKNKAVLPTPSWFYAEPSMVFETTKTPKVEQKFETGHPQEQKFETGHPLKSNLDKPDNNPFNIYSS